VHSRLNHSVYQLLCIQKVFGGFVFNGLDRGNGFNLGMQVAQMPKIEIDINMENKAAYSRPPFPGKETI
jgi:hypothetical protein